MIKGCAVRTRLVAALLVRECPPIISLAPRFSITEPRLVGPSVFWEYLRKGKKKGNLEKFSQERAPGTMCGALP